MRVLLCSDPLTPGLPDAAFEAEADAIAAVGLSRELLDVEALAVGRVDRALRRLPITDVGLLVYRGWMLPVESYATLVNGLAERDGTLINDPSAYRRTHELPGWYDTLVDVTPRSTWIAGMAPFDPPLVRAAIASFGDGPIVVKDYVKSRKHDWDEAFYIPTASDWPVAKRVVDRFVELQGPDLAGGLVFREFVELEPVGRHPRSNLPLSREHRLFFLDGQLLAVGRYWEDAQYTDDVPVERLSELAARIDSRFFVMDIAKSVAGEWIVIELGDGQVSGLPATVDPTIFYRDLARRLT